MNRGRWLVLILGLLLAFPCLGRSEDSAATQEAPAIQEPQSTPFNSHPISGRVFTDLYTPVNSGTSISDSDLQQLSGSVWLQLDPKVSENTWAHIILSGNEIAASSSGTTQGFQFAIREAEITYSRWGLDIRGGKMIIPWGKSDIVNPTDFLTAKDYTFFNPDDEVRRSGAFGVLFSWTPESGNSPWTFTWVSLPLFARSQLLLAPGQVSTQVTGTSTVSPPPANLANAESAFRVAYSGNKWDVSASVYRGWNHLAEFEIVSVTGLPATPSVQVVQRFHRTRAAGLDGSLALGSWIFRGETSYTWTENDDGQNPLIQPSRFDAVVGFERPLGGDFRIQAQGLFRYYPRYLAPSQLSNANPLLTPVYQQVAQANALIQNYQDAFRPSTSLRLSYANDQNGWSGELLLLGNWVGGGLLVRPQINYLVSDAVKTTVGLDYYSGPRDRPLGVLGAYSAGFSELKYSF